MFAPHLRMEARHGWVSWTMRDGRGRGGGGMGTNTACAAEGGDTRASGETGAADREDTIRLQQSLLEAREVF